MEDRRARWWWLVAVVVLGLILGVVSGFTQGGCYDSTDPAASYCYSEPMLTVPGLWIAWSTWAVLAGFAVWRALRAGGVSSS